MAFLNYLLFRLQRRLQQKADPVCKKLVYSSLNWLVFSIKNGDDLTPQPETLRQNIIITR